MHKENLFDGVTILVLAVNETESLRRTVSVLEQALSPDDVRKILIFYPPRVTADCEAVINELAAERFPIPVLPEKQVSAGFGESFMHVFRKEKDVTHTILWASDGEVVPEMAALLVNAAKEDPRAFVKLSRMMKGGSQPAGKSLFLKLRDRTFCLLARVWLRTNITDVLFFCHVLFPLAPFDSYCLTEAGPSILIEVFHLFSRLGTRFIEFPVQAMQRAEAKSTIKLKQKFQVLFYLLRLGRVARTPRGKQA